MILVSFGDSWAWGAELVDPAEEKVPIMTLPGGGFDRQFKPINMEYRLKHRYVNVFAEKINADCIIDFSKPSNSNDAIFRNVVSWLSNDVSNLNKEEIFVSIGWTSPERAEFYYDNNYISAGPWSIDQFKNTNSDLHLFFNLYYKYFSEPQWFFQKYLQTIWATQTLLDSFNIKYAMHQAFYHHFDEAITSWNDRVYKEKYMNINFNNTLQNLWNNIDDVKFINKNSKKLSTAHSVMVDVGGLDNVFEVFHPNALGHKIWGDYLFKHCTENNLL